MYRAVKEVRPEADHTLSLVFDDGTHGKIDMKPFLDFGVFQRLRDEAAFRSVRVAFDTVEWDCGVDLDPEFLWEKAGGRV